MCDGEGGGSGGVAAARAAEVVSARASEVLMAPVRAPTLYGGRRYRPPTILQQRRWLTKRRWSCIAAAGALRCESRDGGATPACSGGTHPNWRVDPHHKRRQSHV